MTLRPSGEMPNCAAADFEWSSATRLCSSGGRPAAGSVARSIEVVPPDANPFFSMQASPFLPFLHQQRVKAPCSQQEPGVLVVECALTLGGTHESEGLSGHHGACRRDWADGGGTS